MPCGSPVLYHRFMKIIDVHTHGINGYDTRTTVAEHILEMARIQGAQGVSEIIPTIYPAKIRIMRENMMMVREAMERQKDSNKLKTKDSNKLQVTSNELKTNDKDLSLSSDPLLVTRNSLLVTKEVTRHSSFILGVHLEGPFLNFSRCGSLNAMTFLEPTEYHLSELIEGFEDMVKIITIAPELNGAAGLIRKMADKGIVASMGHSDATFSEAERGFHSGAKGITHIFNAMRSFHHREPGLAGFGLTNQDIYIEVIADPYHLHPKTLELIFSAKNPDRVIIISDTVKETTPFTKGQGVADMHGRLLGGALTIPEAAELLIEAGFDRGTVMKCLTENPERYLKNSDK